MLHLIICQLFLHRSAVLTGKRSRAVSAALRWKIIFFLRTEIRKNFSALTLSPPPFSHLSFVSFQSAFLNYSSLTNGILPEVRASDGGTNFP